MNEYHKSNGTSSGGSVYQTIAEVAEAQGIGPPHYVLHNPKKRRIAKGWQATPASAEAATQHRGLVGVIPSSPGMVAIDLDHGGSGGVVSVQALLGPPLKVIPTAKEGHFHLYYREPATGCPMYQWQYKGASAEGPRRRHRGSIGLNWYPGYHGYHDSAHEATGRQATPCSGRQVSRRGPRGHRD